MTEERDAGGAKTKISPGINYEKGAAETINKVKRLGDKRDRTKAEAGSRKTTEERDTLNAITETQEN